MTSRPLVALLAIAGLAVSIGLGACGSDQSSSGGSGVQSSAKEASAESSPAEAPPEDQPQATDDSELPEAPAPPDRVDESPDLSDEPAESAGSDTPVEPAPSCTTFADSTYIPYMTSTVLERTDGVRVSIQHSGAAAHAVYIASSDGLYDGQTLFRAPSSFYNGEVQVIGVTQDGYKIQPDPEESQVVTGPVTRAILHVCTDLWRQVGGRTDIW